MDRNGGLNELFGFIDPFGKEIIPLKYERVYIPAEGLIAAKMNNKWGYIDLANKTIIPFQFTGASNFQKVGTTILAGARKDKWGYIDLKGNFVIAQQYDSVQKFGKELAPVSLSMKWGYIDSKGKTVIPHQFDYAKGFVNDTAIVVLNDILYLLNPKGDKVEPEKVVMSEWLAEQVQSAKENIQQAKENAKTAEKEARLPLKLNFYVGSANNKRPDKDADKKAQEVWDIHKAYIEKAGSYYQQFNEYWAELFSKGYDSATLVSSHSDEISSLFKMTQVRINDPFLQSLKQLELAKGDNLMADAFTDFLTKQNEFFNEVFHMTKYFRFREAGFSAYIKRLQETLQAQQQAQQLLFKAAEQARKRNNIK